jgi:hypothetical protein
LAGSRGHYAWTVVGRVVKDQLVQARWAPETRDTTPLPHNNGLAQVITGGQENLDLRGTKVTISFQIGNKTIRLYDVEVALSSLPLFLRNRHTHHPMSAAAATIAIANRA